LLVAAEKSLIRWPDASSGDVLRTDYVVTCERNIGCARKCHRKFCSHYPAAIRNACGRSAPAKLAKKTIDYATAKTAYFNALRAEVSELIDIATSKETRPPEVDIFVAAFVVAGSRFNDPTR
jgi:hypothetical protein